jgi:hypothetical protein
MKPSFLITLNLAVLLVAGCSSTPTKVDNGPIHAATFSFIAKAPSLSPEFADKRAPIHAMIQDSISRNLASKGLGKVASGGDLVVAYLVIIGINASKSVSPIDFLLPGLMQNCPPSPTIPIQTNTVPMLAQASLIPL